MAITVFEITNPEALNVPGFEDFAKRVVESYPYLDGSPDVAVHELPALIADPDVNVLAAADGPNIKALAVLVHGTDQFAPVPQVAHFYNEGRAAVKRELVDRITDIVKERGYDKFWAVNATDKANSVWARAFRRAGKSYTIGSIMEFEI